MDYLPCEIRRSLELRLLGFCLAVRIGGEVAREDMVRSEDVKITR